MRVAVTGAGGFLGLHVRAALREAGATAMPVSLGDRLDEAAAVAAVDGADAVLHLAGVHRAPDEEVHEGNALLADQLRDVLLAVRTPPATIGYASTTQVGNGTAYGEAKERAGDVLREAATSIGARFVEHRLPNLFGEHGRPFANSVTATFCHLLATGGRPEVHEDRTLELLHAQDAADLLLGDDAARERAHRESVAGLLARLERIASAYDAGDVPDIGERLDRDLFNTYRSHLVTRRPAIPLTSRTDARGTFVELVRARGGSGQASSSTTAPGVTRGDHFHRRKFERFAVVSGRAVIRLRRILTTDVVEIPVDGDAPVAVDMPTLWSHSIENVGDVPLHTSFWTDDLFDPTRPDTIAEPVLA
ncbi:polysaccharide biosynthesis C-terminal domain-containing protein [Agrococcus sp. SGAir0287]|uniref:polysaccharide biosynthesis C-terminal domain-containing protein n=1 Tax=Agrococcus sp. SGAir0287 TaxID=2070347 RepID=UPI0010CD09B2|nr:NAD-dependent epimerase/dehydratase family protein [Agrococcus sp. SGAir0287]QCR20812.1 capsular biosynthesis protein [Agrococcus sp. SGAir0287]